MNEYEPIETGVEVNGQTVLSVVEAFPAGLQSQGERILASHGIDEPEEGSWYEQAAWLSAFGELYDSLGERSIEKIGKTIPKTAEWPPGTDDIVSGVESIDRAYHMNHRGGEIGSYSAEKVEEGLIRVTCDNPYPCPFDRGILKGVVSEFGERRAAVKEVGEHCREEGAKQCEYEVSW